MDSSSRVGLSLRYLKVGIFVFAVMVTGVILIFTYFRFLDQSGADQIVTQSKKDIPVNDVSKKNDGNRIDFGAKVPEDFPTNIPLESGVMMTQSYRLDYPGQKQLTVTFLSQETVKKNFGLYAKFLQKDQWAISNAHESKILSFLYATKDTNEMNITVSAVEDSGSQVSISVLKK